MVDGRDCKQDRIWRSVVRRSNLAAPHGHRAFQQVSASTHDFPPSTNAKISAPEEILASSALSTVLKLCHESSCGCAVQQLSQKNSDLNGRDDGRASKIQFYYQTPVEGEIKGTHTNCRRETGLGCQAIVETARSAVV